jgi:4-carboxymuconolactone decarboxylase
MKARIEPLQPPYDPDTERMLQKWMPPGADVEPLVLFRTLARHPDLMSRMRPLGAGILGSATVEPRERELMILRTTALNGAFYEWGVHATAFGPSVGIDEDDARALAEADAADDERWSDADRIVIALADELQATSTVSDELWAQLQAGHSVPQVIELIATAGWYRLLSYVINAAELPPEAWAARAEPAASA